MEPPNYPKLLWAKAMVVSVRGKSEQRLRQLSTTETNGVSMNTDIPQGNLTAVAVSKS